MWLLLSRERIAPPRPGKNAIGGQIREFTNEGQVGGFKGAIGAKKSSCLGALEGIGAGFVTDGRHLGIFIRLGDHCAPKSAFRLSHKSSEIKKGRNGWLGPHAGSKFDGGAVICWGAGLSLALTTAHAVERFGNPFTHNPRTTPFTASSGTRLPTIPEPLHSRRLHETCKTVSLQRRDGHTAPMPRLKYLHECTRDSAALRPLKFGDATKRSAAQAF